MIGIISSVSFRVYWPPAKSDHRVLRSWRRIIEKNKTTNTKNSRAINTLFNSFLSCLKWICRSHTRAELFDRFETISVPLDNARRKIIINIRVKIRKKYMETRYCWMPFEKWVVPIGLVAFLFHAKKCKQIYLEATAGFRHLKSWRFSFLLWWSGLLVST